MDYKSRLATDMLFVDYFYGFSRFRYHFHIAHLCMAQIVLLFENTFTSRRFDLSNMLVL